MKKRERKDGLVADDDSYLRSFDFNGGANWETKETKKKNLREGAMIR